ncbi:MAG: hypothetical protein ABIH53_02940 [archaeon]
MKLKEVGIAIKGILISVTVFQVIYILLKYCDFQDINTASVCIEKIIYAFIPTEVTILEVLKPVPIISVIVLILYRIIVKD